MDMYEYLKKNGKKTFEELEFNEVDNLILSVLTYLDYTGIIPEGIEYKTLREIGIEYLHTHKEKDVKELGVAQKDAYKLLDVAISTKRYKDILVHHYRYISDLDTQFSAMTFKLTKKIKYVAFEGTDELLSGWKEDFILSYKFPVKAQELAIMYLNNEISLFDKHIYVGGHSKGGNLALVSAMYVRKYKKHKIVKVYSNDGPGLRKEQFESKEYKSIENKYVHIIPHYSYVGTMLTNGEYKVIKSKRKDILCHSSATWLIDDTSFILTPQSEISKRFENKLNEFIDGVSDEEKEELCINLFGRLEKLGMKDLTQIKDIKLITSIIKEMNTLDKKYKDLLIDIVEIIIKSLI